MPAIPPSTPLRPRELLLLLAFGLIGIGAGVVQYLNTFGAAELAATWKEIWWLFVPMVLVMVVGMLIAPRLRGRGLRVAAVLYVLVLGGSALMNWVDGDPMMAALFTGLTFIIARRFYLEGASKPAV